MGSNFIESISLYKQATQLPRRGKRTNQETFLGISSKIEKAKWKNSMIKRLVRENTRKCVCVYVCLCLCVRVRACTRVMEFWPLHFPAEANKTGRRTAASSEIHTSITLTTRSLPLQLLSHAVSFHLLPPRGIIILRNTHTDTHALRRHHHQGRHQLVKEHLHERDS